ncbi:zinc finger protein 862-like [Gigantopelta aegis]|uniref:zinc finger protein 862-like n=1 Tax=Gigantopelta aegis TaxID=1735272 RepID=UPI001B88CAA6|nr:zinc finger protein 862-like [Gigantopelta aegis]
MVISTGHDSSDDDATLYCICNNSNSDSKMIACDSADCPHKPFEWFHFSCMKLNEVEERTGRKMMRKSNKAMSVTKLDKPGLHKLHERSFRSLHEFAVNLINQEKKSNEGNPDEKEECTEPTAEKTKDDKKVQGHIDEIFISQSSSSYSKLFRTALYIVNQDEPYTKFKALVKLQKANGVKIMDGKSNRSACKEMIHTLAEVVRQDVKNILKTSNFMSGMCDGSEARKSREEKELVFAKVVVGGKPVCVFLKCQRMRDFGGTDASSLQKAFVSAFESFDVDIILQDSLKLISVCADGASVNMGVINGAMTTLKMHVPSLLVVHCSLHKLELAVADAYKKSSEFKDIDDFMMNLFYLFRNSGKNWRLMLLIAEKLDVNIRRLPKVHGTRFQTHKEKGLQVLLYNFCVLLIFAENAIETRGLVTPVMKDKIRGYHRKMLQFEFVGCVALYHEVLQTTAHVTSVLEADDTLITDIFDVLEECHEKLQEISSREKIMPPEALGSFECKKNDDDSVTVMKATSTNLPSRLVLRDKQKLTAKQRVNLEKKLVKEVTHTQEFQLTKVEAGERKMTHVKTSLVKDIDMCIKDRFDSLKENDVIKSMVFVDHTRWDPTDDNYGISEIDTIAEHFSESLAKYKFNIPKPNF